MATYGQRVKHIPRAALTLRLVAYSLYCGRLIIVTDDQLDIGLLEVKQGSERSDDDRQYQGLQTFGRTFQFLHVFAVTQIAEQILIRQSI